MSQSDPSLPVPHGGVEPLRRRTTLPSWLISAMMHAVLMLVLGLPLWSTPRRGVVAVRTADVGIVLKHQHRDDQYYESGNDTAQTDLNAAAPTDTSSPVTRMLITSSSTFQRASRSLYRRAHRRSHSSQTLKKLKT